MSADIQGGTRFPEYDAERRNRARRGAEAFIDRLLAQGYLTAEDRQMLADRLTGIDS